MIISRMDDGPFLESVCVRTLLGIRFWDFVADHAVQSDLHVTAAVPGSRARPRTAFRSLGGVYGFDDLFGMVDQETCGASPPASSPPASSPPSARTYWVEVWHRRGWYLPMGFELDVPASGLGLYLGDVAASPPTSAGRGVYLFSSPTRPVALPIAAVRGQLYDVDRGAFAAHALIEVTLPDPALSSPPASPPRPRTRYGISDAEGRFLVAFVYPEFDLGAIDSPPSPPAGAVISPRAQRWDLRVAVRYDHLAITPPHRAPDLRAILGQAPAMVWPTPAVVAPDVVRSLSFDRELVVSTDTQPTLWVRSGTSP